MAIRDYDDHCYTARLHFGYLASAYTRVSTPYYASPIRDTVAKPWEWLCFAHSAHDGGEVFIRPSRREIGLYAPDWKNHPRYPDGTIHWRNRSRRGAAPPTRCTPCRNTLHER